MNDILNLAVICDMIGKAYANGFVNGELWFAETVKFSAQFFLFLVRKRIWGE